MTPYIFSSFIHNNNNNKFHLLVTSSISVEPMLLPLLCFAMSPTEVKRTVSCEYLNKTSRFTLDMAACSIQWERYWVDTVTNQKTLCAWIMQYWLLFGCFRCHSLAWFLFVKTNWARMWMETEDHHHGMYRDTRSQLTHTHKQCHPVVVSQTSNVSLCGTLTECAILKKQSKCDWIIRWLCYIVVLCGRVAVCVCMHTTVFRIVMRISLLSFIFVCAKRNSLSFRHTHTNIVRSHCVLQVYIECQSTAFDTRDMPFDLIRAYYGDWQK